MSKPKISVIIPIYDVEDYLTETLNSILNQSMIDDIEVIMVDDGSTDESRYIVDRYALDYDNFHAYHKENEGQGKARNFGLERANGDYIHFLDSDDFLVSDAYEILYDLARKNGSDIALSGVLRFARYNAWDDILYKNSFLGIDEDIPSTTLAGLPQLVWDTSASNKIYKREFLEKNDITFLDDRTLFEDLLYAIETYAHAETITVTKDILYYWRLRSDHSSVTQQDMDVKNIKDRLKILRLIDEFLKDNDADSGVVNEEYMKWINHDLKFFIKRFDHFPQNYHRELFDEIHDLVSRIPSDLIESLNSYKKIIFKMVLNRDFDSFVEFAPLENELYENPHVPEFLSDEYSGYFDFNKAIMDEELIVELADFDFDEDNAYLRYEGKMNYLADDIEADVSANLIDNGDAYPLEVTGSQIKVPFSLIRDKIHTKVQITYSFKDFSKESLLKNRHRQSMEFDDFYLDLNMGINSHLVIDMMKRNESLVEINDISWQDGDFNLKGTSKDKISEVYIENILSFDRIACPVKYDGDEFYFTIRGTDISEVPVKKWEINCDESPNSIKVSKSFEFYAEHEKIRFISSRNKILIECDVWNGKKVVLQEYGDLKSEVAALRHENSRLTRQNSQLNERIEEFKTRKVVKIADKLKFN